MAALAKDQSVLEILEQVNGIADVAEALKDIAKNTSRYEDSDPTTFREVKNTELGKSVIISQNSTTSEIIHTNKNLFTLLTDGKEYPKKLFPSIQYTYTYNGGDTFDAMIHSGSDNGFGYVHMIPFGVGDAYTFKVECLASTDTNWDGTSTPAELIFSLFDKNGNEITDEKHKVVPAGATQTYISAYGVYATSARNITIENTFDDVAYVKVGARFKTGLGIATSQWGTFRVQLEKGKSATAFVKPDVEKFAPYDSMPYKTSYFGGTDLFFCNDGFIVFSDLIASSGNGGAVQSVNGQVGTVVLTAEDVGAEPASESNIVKRNADVIPYIEGASSSYIGTDSNPQEKHAFTMLVSTDVHATEDARKDYGVFHNVIDFLNSCECIDAGVCLGDITNSYYSDTDGTWYTSLVNKSVKPFFTTLGNHDTGNSTNPQYAATVANAFAKWIQPTAKKIGILDIAKPYYAVNTDRKVTLIFLNNYDTPDAMNGSAFAVHRGVECISQAQIDWLLATLDAVPAGNTLCVCMHSYPYANTSDAGVFTQVGSSVVGSTAPVYAEIIPDIINAWQNGAALNKTYTPTLNPAYGTVSALSNVTVNHSFSSRGAGVFGCYIVGHVHKDTMAHSTVYEAQKIVSLCATSNEPDQNRDADLPRGKGKTMDAITTVSVDTGKRLIKLVRVGSNVTTGMVERKCIAIPY